METLNLVIAAVLMLALWVIAYHDMHDNVGAGTVITLDEMVGDR